MDSQHATQLFPTNNAVMGLRASLVNSLGQVKKLESVSHPWVLLHAFLLAVPGGIQKQTKRWPIYVTSSRHQPQCSVRLGPQKITETRRYLQHYRDGVQR